MLHWQTWSLHVLLLDWQKIIPRSSVERQHPILLMLLGEVRHSQRTLPGEWKNPVLSCAAPLQSGCLMLSGGILGLTVPVGTWHSQSLAQSSLGCTYPGWVKHLNLSWKIEQSKFTYNRSITASNDRWTTLGNHPAGSDGDILVATCKKMGDASCVDRSRRWFCTLKHHWGKILG